MPLLSEYSHAQEYDNTRSHKTIFVWFSGREKMEQDENSNHVRVLYKKEKISTTILSDKRVNNLSTIINVRICEEPSIVNIMKSQLARHVVRIMEDKLS